MKTFSIFANIAIGSILSLTAAFASAEIYRFDFFANPDALERTQDRALDVRHTITIDSSRIPSFDSFTLSQTESWLNGGIQLEMSHQGKSVRLNDGLDASTTFVSLDGAYYSEGFLDLYSSTGPWFFALEFAPDSPFIDSNDLPYDPFVYGFLFAYQNDQAYQDFRSLWTLGNTSILPNYQVSAVSEPSIAVLTLLGLFVSVAAAKKRRIFA